MVHGFTVFDPIEKLISWCHEESIGAIYFM